MELEKRFEQKIRDAEFNLFEISGFQQQPKLALMAGMAIGYKMGMEDSESRLIDNAEKP